METVRNFSTACLVIIICLNSLVPRSVISPDQSHHIYKLLSSQSQIINVCILSSLPLKIISEYLGEQNKPSSSSGGKQSSHSDNSTSGSSLDPALLEKKINVQNYSASGLFKGAQIYTGIIPFDSRQPEGNCEEKQVVPLFLILLLFFFLLPRSSINEDSILSFLRNNQKPTWKTWLAFLLV